LCIDRVFALVAPFDSRCRPSGSAGGSPGFRGRVRSPIAVAVFAPGRSPFEPGNARSGGNETLLALPTIKSVKLNDLEGMLADVKMEGWKG
jgi:hypothetical protein